MTSDYLISWNCNGLKPHLSDLLHFLDIAEPKPFIICLQESNLHTPTLPNINNYTLLNTPRIDNMGGGTAIYIKSNIPYTQSFFQSPLDPDIEYTTVTIKYYDSNLSITSMYIRPQAKITIQNLTDLKLNTKHLIMGDLNGKHSLWGSPKNDLRGNILYDFIENQNLICLNNGNGTRIGNLGQLSHLDIVLSTSNISSNMVFEILDDTWGSDHFPIKISTFFKPNIIIQPDIPKWNFKKANWNTFKESIDTLLSCNYNLLENNILLDDLQIFFL